MIYRSAVAAFLLTLTVSSALGDEWTDLISPRGIEGWKGDVASWQVKDGVLIGRADGTLKANRFIIADIAPVINFELTVDVWISKGGNSGLQYRSTPREDLGPNVVTGYQCDVVADRQEYNAMLYEERGRRILAHTGEKVVIDPDGQPWVVGNFPVKAFAPETWHSYRVLVSGNHHQHFIDGHQTVDVVDLDERHRSMMGVVGVQVHVGPKMEVRYKNFRLKRLEEGRQIYQISDVPIPDDAPKVVPQGGWNRAGRKDQNARLAASVLPGTRNVHVAGNVMLAGQPSEDALAELSKRGFKTVVSLRHPAEERFDEASLCEQLGMKFVRLQISAPRDLDRALIQRACTILRSAEPDAGVLLHCASANRVGAIWLAHRVQEGRMAIQQARDEAAQVGLKTKELEEKALEYLEN